MIKRTAGAIALITKVAMGGRVSSSARDYARMMIHALA
jgi:hypothetical protein